jgi:hypothetical protein
MTRFTPKFFISGRGVLQKQGAHSRLGELLVHLKVTGLAAFHARIPFLGPFGLFVLPFCRPFGKTEKENHSEIDKSQCGYKNSAHHLPFFIKGVTLKRIK